MDLSILLILGCVGAVAGFVDAVAGGGGLVTVPALLSVGVPPVGALATNKAQAVIGTTMAAYTYWRRGLVRIRDLLVPVAATFVGAMLGALAVTRIDTSLLEIAVPVAIIAVALYFVLSPAAGDVDRHARLRIGLFLPLIGFAIGFYDGVFGPGTGSFFMLGFVALFGLGITRALAHTKILNVVSNFAALLLFMAAGQVIWPVAGAMAVGQVIGGRLGALTGLRFGARVIRPLVIAVSIALAVRLVFFG